MGASLPSGWNMSSNMSPKRSSIGKKEVSVVYYPPDGSGRDSYVIRGHGGTCNEYKMSNFDYQKDYLRNNSTHPYKTPIMD
jgi:hypothetical protein